MGALGELRRGIRLVSWVAVFAAAGAAAQAADVAVKTPPQPWPVSLATAVPMFGDFLIDNDGLVRRGTFKVAENETVRPTDRIFYNYNYFSDVNRGNNINGEQLNIHRQTIGFEKTFLDGNASVGVRLPFLHNLNGTTNNNQDDTLIGDLTFIGKYALINDRATGTVISLGLAVTAPSGQIPVGFDPSRNQQIHSTVLQPFIGWNVNVTPDLFLHGFTSLAIPTDSRDVSFLFNSVGVGYWLYRAPPSNAVTGVIPTFEVHVNTPLNNREFGVPETFDTTVNVTGGVHVVFLDRFMFGAAVGAPLTGPRPFDLEVIANFNMRFGPP